MKTQLNENTAKIKLNKVFWKKSLKILIPIILSQMIQTSVSFVDNFMISKYDSSIDKPHMTAVGMGAEIWFAMQSIFLAIGILFSIFYGQFKKNKNLSTDIFKINIQVSLLFMIIVSLVMFFGAESLVKLFLLSDGNSSIDALKIATKYVRILSLGNVFISIFYLLINPLIIMRSKTKYLFFVAIISLITNIIFDYIFIYILDQGAEGAAWSTTFSYSIQFLIGIYLFLKNKDIFNNYKNIFNYNKKLWKSIFSRIQMIFVILAFNWSLVALTILWANIFGAETIKSLAIGYPVAGIMFSIFAANNQAIKIIVSDYLSNSQFKMASKISMHLFTIVITITLFLASTVAIISLFLPNIIFENKHTIKQTRWIILIYALAFPSFVVTEFFACVIESGGQRLAPALLNYFTQITIVAPLTMIFGSWGIGLSFEWTFLISQCSMYLVAIITFVWWKREKWHINLQEQIKI